MKQHHLVDNGNEDMYMDIIKMYDIPASDTSVVLDYFPDFVVMRHKEKGELLDTFLFIDTSSMIDGYDEEECGLQQDVVEIKPVAKLAIDQFSDIKGPTSEELINLFPLAFCAGEDQCGSYWWFDIVD